MTSNSMADGGMERIRITSTSAQSHYIPSSKEGTAGMGNAIPTMSRRYGTQAYFWTSKWQQGERLADFDVLIGDEYRPSSVEDLFTWLDSDEE